MNLAGLGTELSDLTLLERYKEKGLQFDLFALLSISSETKSTKKHETYVRAFSLKFSQKLNIMKLLFSFPSEIFSLKPVLGACLYAVSNSGSLHTYEQTLKSYN